MVTSVSTKEAKNNFSRLIELAHFKNRQIEIRRNQRPMAWLVGTSFMQAVGQLLEYAGKHKVGWAETVEVLSDPELMAAIEEGQEAVRAGKTLPIEQALEE